MTAANLVELCVVFVLDGIRKEVMFMRYSKIIINPLAAAVSIAGLRMSGLFGHVYVSGDETADRLIIRRFNATYLSVYGHSQRLSTASSRCINPPATVLWTAVPLHTGYVVPTEHQSI